MITKLLMAIKQEGMLEISNLVNGKNKFPKLVINTKESKISENKRLKTLNKNSKKIKR